VRIRWTKTAKSHLRAIHDYIANDSPYYARGMIDRLTKRVGILTTFPEIGPVVPEYNQASIRELFEHPYLVLVGRRDVSIGITKKREGDPIYDQLTRIALAHITKLQDVPHPTSKPEGNGAAS
jgi:plasmid stabilization system protein ParE